MAPIWANTSDSEVNVKGMRSECEGNENWLCSDLKTLDTQQTEFNDVLFVSTKQLLSIVKELLQVFTHLLHATITSH
jgi:hypothetical protein